MCLPHLVIPAHKGGQRYAFRCRERCIPPRAVLDRTYLLTVPVYVFPRCLMAHKLPTSCRVLAFREPLEVFLVYFSAQSPLLGKPAVPFAAYQVALRVIVLAGVGELFRVIRLRLARAQGIGDGWRSQWVDATVARSLLAGGSTAKSRSRELIQTEHHPGQV